MESVWFYVARGVNHHKVNFKNEPIFEKGRSKGVPYPAVERRKRKEQTWSEMETEKELERNTNSFGSLHA
jgi:hypothetical protein